MENETHLCPLGFNCFQMGIVDGQECINKLYCQDYTEPWPLPYHYEDGCLTVNLRIYHEDIEACGWANAVNLDEERFSSLIRKINSEIRRLGWDLARCRDLLVEMTGKRSRVLCTESELEEYLRYLQNH